MQSFEMLSEHQEIPRPFSFAIYGAVHNVHSGSVLVLSTPGHDVSLGMAIANTISKSNNSPAIAVLTSEDTHAYYVPKVREGGVGRYQNVTLYKHATGAHKELLDTLVNEHTASIFIADFGGLTDVMNIQRTFIATGRLAKAILIIISPDGITPGAVDVDVIHSAGNVQMD
jgi:hypothetical protein